MSVSAAARSCQTSGGPSRPASAPRTPLSDPGDPPAPGIDPVVTELEPRKRFRISLRVTERAPLGDVTGKLCLRVREGPVEEVREVGIFGSIGS